MAHCEEVSRLRRTWLELSLDRLVDQEARVDDCFAQISDLLFETIQVALDGGLEDIEQRFLCLRRHVQYLNEPQMPLCEGPRG